MLLVQKYTGGLCIKNAGDYGFGKTSVWVRNNCRAEFKVCGSFS
jgi:hypothetical protein